ncbi:MAG: hypothetical protein H6813_03840 [Phycisphaeraceae bacterium]|nr:hypothetical protein [Phycisphaeraceae bacterium]MCB9847079.1 hypothetical protein [Phycisphaeraceae bacterium]
MVLIAAPAMVWQTSFLAAPPDDQQSSSGARDLWRWMSGYQAGFPGCLTVNTEAYAYIEQDGSVVVHCLEQGDYGAVPFISIDDTPVRQSGVWAPTWRHYPFKRWIHLVGVGEVDEYNFIREDGPVQFSDEYFRRAIRAVAPVYRERSVQFNPVAYRALRSGEQDYSEPIYAGYAHNALALFLLGMSGRGLFNSRRWWRAVKSRLRRGKNRCVACEYDLAGLGAGVCPECGEVFDPGDDDRNG